MLIETSRLQNVYGAFYQAMSPDRMSFALALRPVIAGKIATAGDSFSSAAHSPRPTNVGIKWPETADFTLYTTVFPGWAIHRNSF